VEARFGPRVQQSHREMKQEPSSTPTGAGNRAKCNSAARQFEGEGILGERKSVRQMRHAEKMSTKK